jgi:hypothetical protein
MKKLQLLQPGDSVWCGTESMLAPPTFEKVEDIITMADPTGDLFSGIKLACGQIFDSRTANAVTPPLNYYIMKL